MLSENGEWRWELFGDKLPYSCLLQVAAVTINKDTSEQECCFWQGSSNGTFSVKSTYQLLDKSDENGRNSEYWRRVWKWKGPERVRTFLWLCLRGKLLTNYERVRRHLSNSGLCGRCGLATEDLDPVLRKCPFAKSVWVLLLNDTGHYIFMETLLIG